LHTLAITFIITILQFGVSDGLALPRAATKRLLQ